MNIKLILITVIFTFLSAISSWANNTSTIDQRITSIVVKKSDRKMYLFSGEKVLRRYRIGPVSYTHLTLPTNREV